jgi:hypothetical protein
VFGRVEPGWGLVFLYLQFAPIYAVEGVALVIFLYQVWHLQVGHGFTSIIAFGVASPLDQILQLFLPSMTSVAPNGLDFVLFFTFYQVQGWPRVVLAMFFCFNIRGKD